MMPAANRRILVVDDQEDLRLQVAKLLQQGSSSRETSSLIEQIRSRISRSRDLPSHVEPVRYRVDTVGQGQDAFAMVKNSFGENEPYALIFLDMRMPPGWDGLETAQRIRSIDKEIQIVIMTAYADYEQQEIAERIGEPDKLIYLKKPFHPEEIRQLALAMTEKWNMNRRENERVILTNRLMRENSHLTHRAFKDLPETFRAVLDAFIFFLDARDGVFVRHLAGGQHELCAATSETAHGKLLDLAQGHAAGSAKMAMDDRAGSALFPISFDQFQGTICIGGKKLVFAFEQLHPFLEILVETAHEVLKNAFLLSRHRERTRLEELGLAMQLVAEQIRGELDEISAHANALLDCDDEAERRRLCQLIAAAETKVLAPCLEMLDFTGFGAHSLTLAEIPVARLVEQAANIIRPALKDMGAELALKVADQPRTLTCDGAALGRALRQLLAVSVASLGRATTPGRLEIRTRPEATGLTIIIDDNGAGMEEAEAAQLFAPFVDTGEGGVGPAVGPAVAQRLVEKHGGRVSYQTSPSGGGTFEIELPSTPAAT